MKIALIKEDKVDNVIVADEAFLEHSDARWRALFTEFHLLNDEVRVAGGFELSEPRGPGVHDLRSESAEALQALYLAPEPPAPTEPASEAEAEEPEPTSEEPEETP